MDMKDPHGSGGQWRRIDWLNRHDQPAWRVIYNVSMLSGILLANPAFILGFGFAIVPGKGALAAAGTVGLINGAVLYALALGAGFYPRVRPWAMLSYSLHLLVMILVYSSESPLH
jgi:hypothetical protein